MKRKEGRRVELMFEKEIRRDCNEMMGGQKETFERERRGFKRQEERREDMRKTQKWRGDEMTTGKSGNKRTDKERMNREENYRVFREGEEARQNGR
ncbi:hypothetical protein PBY51_006106 [Eleginops maclovinus]|uniref:Uncharacterized protein n=1 Tax=Eleginops maclovinus TaxID=56733 RepID=A0AAN8AAX7_ELEMC|nr:hypothetical protein PBY51_006106 [Eleginops maclovinus]